KFYFFLQAEDGIRGRNVTGVQTCALPISTFPEYIEGNVVSYYSQFELKKQYTCSHNEFFFLEIDNLLDSLYMHSATSQYDLWRSSARPPLRLSSGFYLAQ